MPQNVDSFYPHLKGYLLGLIKKRISHLCFFIFFYVTDQISGSCLLSLGQDYEWVY